MLNTSRNIGIMVLLFLCLTACKKYDDDTKRSLKTVKSRLCNKWNLEDASSPKIYEFRKDGVLLINNNPQENTWVLDSDKDYLTIIYSTVETIDHKIDQLEKDKLTIISKFGPLKFTRVE